MWPKKNRDHAVLASYLAGAFMMISGSVGSTSLYRMGYDVLAEWLPFLDRFLFWILVVISVLAGLGGLTVLFGGWVLSRGWVFQAKVLITVGVGTGILGLALNLVLVFAGGENPVAELVGIGTTTSGAAVLVSIYARLVAV